MIDAKGESEVVMNLIGFADRRRSRATLAGLLAFGVLVVEMGPVAAQEGDLLVSAVNVAPRPGSTLIDVAYDLATVDGGPVTVHLFLSTDGGASYPHLCRAVTGDVGGGVLPGAGRAIVWDAGADLPGFIGDNCRLRVTADDSPHAHQFVYIGPGTFLMGSSDAEPGRSHDEVQHEVTLTRGFFMCKYEVTEARWEEVLHVGGPVSQLPKWYVSWDGAVGYCNALSELEGLTPAYTINGPLGDVIWHQDADGYRLPTEAEWEYACRAGTTLAYHNDTNCLCSITEANFYGSEHQLPGCPLGVWRSQRTRVGSFPPNPWGLYDMHGNVWEWVWDSYFQHYEFLSPIDPQHPMGPGLDRIFRGGSWHGNAPHLRSAKRFIFDSDSAFGSHGFRVVRTNF